ncbi:MAG TPA: alpha/beta hydrolase-fold protein [Candidatus Limnocylindrales bacterium]|nr:alpha/beta hydrolase-fold protein [Candidatus Limnocylindrales bacterium]
MPTRLTAALLIIIALIATACATPAASPSLAATSPGPSGLSDLPTIGTPADDGARIVKVEELGERMRDLTIESPSVGTVQVRLLLPASFGDDPAARFPPLYLLHGADGEYSDWTTKSDVEGITAPTNFLVVMPATATSFVGEGNMQGSGAGGRPEWLPFLATELTELLERNWQASDKRALAGLSFGGYGSILLAARNPGKYQAVASYSGALDIKGLVSTYLEDADPETIAKIASIAEAADGLGAYSTVELAPLLRGTKQIFVSYGNGEPGPLDPPDRRAPSPLEKWCGGGSSLFVSELQKAGIPVTVDAYGDGTHSWEYWDRALRQSLPMFLEAVGEPPLPPSASLGG